MLMYNTFYGFCTEILTEPYPAKSLSVGVIVGIVVGVIVAIIIVIGCCYGAWRWQAI